MGKCQALLAGVVVSLAGCQASSAPTLSPDALVVDQLESSHVGTLADDPLELDIAADLEVAGERIYLVEPRLDRLSVLDTTFNLLARVEATGSGPGELRAPMDVEVLPDGRLAVADMGNGRVSFFDANGGFSRTMAIVAPHHDPAVLDDTTLIVSGLGGRSPRAEMVRPGGLRPFAKAGGEEHEPTIASSDRGLVVRGGGETLIVILRDGTGGFEVFDPQGTLLRSDVLPASALKRLQAKRRAFLEATEGAGRLVTFKSAAVTEDGRIIANLSIGDPFAVVYSPTTGGFTLLRPPEDEDLSDLLVLGDAMDIAHGRLYVATEGGIHAFRFPVGGS